MAINITTNWAGVVQESVNIRKTIIEAGKSVPSGWHESMARDIALIELDVSIGTAIQLSRIADALESIGKALASRPLGEDK